eukprot:823966-Prymnesium_polylepis.1
MDVLAPLRHAARVGGAVAAGSVLTEDRHGRRSARPPVPSCAHTRSSSLALPPSPHLSPLPTVSRRRCFGTRAE